MRCFVAGQASAGATAVEVKNRGWLSILFCRIFAAFLNHASRGAEIAIPVSEHPRGSTVTDDFWDELAMWTALLVYFATWTVVPWLTLGASLWYVGVIWAAVYVLFHIREIVLKGHCYLSADSTAFPAVFVVWVLLGVVLSVSGVTSVTANRLAYVRALVFSFVLGHVLSLAYGWAVHAFGFLADKVLLRFDLGRKDWHPQHEGLAALSRREREVKKRKKE